MRAFQAGRAWIQGLSNIAYQAAAEGSVAIQQLPAISRQGAQSASIVGAAVQQQIPAAAWQQHSFSSRSFVSLANRLPQILHHQQQQQIPSLPCQPTLNPLNLPLRQQQQQLLLPQFGSSVRHFVLQPRRIKYRKAHKSQGFNETICPNTRQLAYGLYGIRAMEHCRLPAKTIEAVRRTMRRTIKKSAMLWIRMNPHIPVTSKPAEVRMGKGKGTLDYWAAVVRPGQIIFEMDRCTRSEAQAALKSIEAKMPIKVGFVEWR